ncbi:cytochrome P450 [Kitasatospora viridis]|uniref:Cytochrome P450 n=1 Tax=Kitasatospora viridis TaxID=281105 RepID=A0A561SAM8_9ACTN|nr:cytochrome P450 [Kitasatospora viridis]TWF71864.1 cytochrome P450 [Kitasatospora viridis]
MTSNVDTGARIPGPVGSPVLGQALELRRDMLRTLDDGFERFGDVVSYRLGPAALRRQVIAVHHPDAVKQVLTEREVFGRRTRSLEVLTELFGRNLVTTDGEAWTRQRRTLQPLFTPRHVLEYAGVMREEAHDFLTRGSVTAGEVVDLVPLTENYALRVLGRTIIRDELVMTDVIGAFNTLVPLIGKVVRERSMKAWKIPLRVPTRETRQFMEVRAQLYGLIRQILVRRSQRTDTPAEPDLLDRLREARDPETGAALTPREVADQALIMLVAGHTTTSNALTFTLYLLGRDPELQEAVAEAARADGLAPADDLVVAAIKEAMRMYPSAYAIGRRTRTATQLHGFPVPAGTNVLISPWVTHRHPAYWERPDVYDPSRFIGPSDRPRYAYLPFGGGPRNCIGEHFAMLEATVLLRTLLREFTITSESADLPVSQLISLRPTGAVPVRFTPRKARG